MSIRGYRYSLLSLLTIAAMSAREIAKGVVNFINLAFAWLAPDPQPLFVGGYSPFIDRGEALDDSLQQSLRHEANHGHRAAARHI